MQKSIYNKNYEGESSNLSLNDWFSKLLNHEKAIAMTVLDHQLVKLIKNMHKLYLDHGHGYFSN